DGEVREADRTGVSADALEITDRLREGRADLAHTPAIDHHHTVLEPAQNVCGGIWSAAGDECGQVREPAPVEAGQLAHQHGHLRDAEIMTDVELRIREALVGHRRIELLTDQNAPSH